MNQCEHFNEDHETCTNADSPYCADFCPMWEHKDACLYSSENDLVRRVARMVIRKICEMFEHGITPEEDTYERDKHVSI